MKTNYAVILIVFLFIISPADAQISNGVESPSDGADLKRERIEPKNNSSTEQIQPAKKTETSFPEPAEELRESFLWGDIDNDGIKDLFVLDLEGNLLFRNLGDNGFEDVTAIAFPDGAGYSQSGFLGDYNKDSLLDLFLFHEDGFALLKNEGNLVFTDVTESLGMDPGLPAKGIELQDLDGDSFDDLVLKTPKGDRIFRSNQGREFGEVNVPLPERIGSISTKSRKDRGNGVANFPGYRRDRTPNTTINNKTGNTPPDPTPGGSADPDPGEMETANWNIAYINDNSPGSVGIGIPEVEGGDDGSTQNDIVDGTISGSDLDVPFSLKTSLANEPLLTCWNTSAQGTASDVCGIHARTDSSEGYAVFAEGKKYAIKGYCGNSTGSNYAVIGEAYSTGGKGIYGSATSATGESIGVLGRSSSNGGVGLYGRAEATSGTTTAVKGYAVSPSGFGGYFQSGYIGAYGRVDATSGITHGLRGKVNSPDGYGVSGSGPDCGVYGMTTASSGFVKGVKGESDAPGGTGVSGEATSTTTSVTWGVTGISHAEQGYGVYGLADNNTGKNYGVFGQTNSETGYAVYGQAPKYGVLGHAESTSGWNAGVYAKSDSGWGRGVYAKVTGTSGVGYGVEGRSEADSGAGVYGSADSNTGNTKGVYGTSVSSTGYGVYGKASHGSGVNYGVYGESSSPNGYGGYFKGKASADIIEIRGGSDLSEQFDIHGAAEIASPEPGMVVCIDPSQPGDLRVSTKAHDRTVAGIISGAGGVNPGMLMGQEGTEASGDSPVALTGRVYCFVETSNGSIEPGDLLTTSDVPGHAMKVTDHAVAQGAIIGKAMTSLETGRGLILVLVALQ